MNPVVVMISRGLCPPSVVAEAQLHCHVHEGSFHLITGKGRIESKQAAAELAIRDRCDLILIEDDVKLCSWQWSEVFRSRNEVLYVDGNCRDGSPSTKKAPNGDITTGTLMVRIPIEILDRLPAPIFEARSIYFDPADGTWEDRGPTSGDRYSDTVLWYKIHQLDPKPTVRSLGHVDHIKHPLNDGTIPLDGPIEVGFF